MKTSSLTMWLASILCSALIAASALCATGCDGSTAPSTNDQAAQTQTTGTFADGDELGAGATQFALAVTGADGTTAHATVHTDAATVGEALVELGVIAGEPGDYGLYVKTVNGETLDYNTHGMYWAFYVDGQYATSGVDSTAIDPGSTYELRAE